MVYKRKTLRTKPPVARKLAKLFNELHSIERRLNNLLPEIESIERDSHALRNHSCKTTVGQSKEELEF